MLTLCCIAYLTLLIGSSMLTSILDILYITIQPNNIWVDVEYEVISESTKYLTPVKFFRKTNYTKFLNHQICKKETLSLHIYDTRTIFIKYNLYQS